MRITSSGQFIVAPTGTFSPLASGLMSFRPTSSYNTLTFLTNKEVFFSNIPTLNAFNCKWSPDGEKLLTMKSNYSNTKHTI